MKATGIIRRIDDLGRVVIPKEVRRICHIREGDSFEIYTDRMYGQPVICFRKSSSLNFLTTLVGTIEDEMMDSATDEQISEVREHFNEIAKILREWEEGE